MNTKFILLISKHLLALSVINYRINFCRYLLNKFYVYIQILHAIILYYFILQIRVKFSVWLICIAYTESVYFLNVCLYFSQY